MLIGIVGFLVRQGRLAADVDDKAGPGALEVAEEVVDRKRIGPRRIEPVVRVVDKAGIGIEVENAFVRRPEQEELVERILQLPFARIAPGHAPLDGLDAFRQLTRLLIARVTDDAVDDALVFGRAGRHEMTGRGEGLP